MVPRLVKITIGGVTRVVDLLRVRATAGFGATEFGTTPFGE